MSDSVSKIQARLPNMMILPLPRDATAVFGVKVSPVERAGFETALIFY